MNRDAPSSHLPTLSTTTTPRRQIISHFTLKVTDTMIPKKVYKFHLGKHNHLGKSLHNDFSFLRCRLRRRRPPGTGRRVQV